MRKSRAALAPAIGCWWSTAFRPAAIVVAVGLAVGQPVRADDGSVPRTLDHSVAASSADAGSSAGAASSADAASDGDGERIDALAKELSRIDEDEDPERLASLLAIARGHADKGGSGNGRRLLEIVRELSAIGTTPALRQAIAAHPKLTVALRPELHRLVARFGDRAVPALIEARHCPLFAARYWADKELDEMNKSAVAEAVQMPSEGLLVDVLDAYGRARDPDASVALIAFAGSDRIAVRTAARAAIEALGPVADRPVREAYEKLVGHSAPVDWDREHLTAGLFRAVDHARLADVYRLVDQGLVAQREGDLERMVARFDEALARDPSIERPPEMAAGYLALGRSLEKGDPPRARTLLERAAFAAPDEATRMPARAELAFLDAEEAASRGYQGPSGYAEVLALDANHTGAKLGLERVRQRSVARTRRASRWGAAASALVAVVVTGWALVRRRRGRASRPRV